MFAPAQHLQRHAVDRPDDLALVAADSRWTFAELDRCVAAVAQRLRDLGIEPRHLVAIDLPPEEDWIVTLALLRIATATVSLTGVADLGGLPVDALLTRPGAPRFTAPRVVAVDRLWIEQAVADADERDDRAATVLYARDDAICRVIMTSGTTGAPRGAALSVRAVQHRLETLHRYWTDERIELNLMTLSTTGGFHTALANLQHGTPYLALPAGDAAVARIAAELRVEVIAGSPVQVGRLVQLVREAGITMPALREVRTAGGAATRTLLEVIGATLAVPVRGVYGSTEGGGVTMRMLGVDSDPTDVGAPQPGIELQIVDESGAPVADGVSGAVRYRSPGMADGYLTGGDDGSFRDGWFFPGDQGRRGADGHLVLEGRTSEIVNVGGVKVDPAAVDAAVEGFPGVVDAATFLIEQTPGVPELGLAVVAAAGCDLRALDALLRQRMPGKHPTVYGQVSVIPRTRTGKVERQRLTEEFARRLARP